MKLSLQLQSSFKIWNKIVWMMLVCSATLWDVNGLQAQAPESFSYQAVVRDSSGAPIENQAISTRLTILIDGGDVYVETHSPITNDFGMINLQVGSGTALTGAFETIDWGGGEASIRVEVDANAGNNFTYLGTSQLLSVPYALYAKNSGDDLGNHTATQNINLGGNWLSGDGSNEGLRINTDGTTHLGVGGMEYFHFLDGRIDVTNTGASIIIGDSAGFHEDLLGNDNVFIGKAAGRETINGTDNIAIGTDALKYNQIDDGNIAIGTEALYYTEIGEDNIGIGKTALFYMIEGDNNIAVGEDALQWLDIGYENVAVGEDALKDVYFGDYNTSIGGNSMSSLLCGYDNTVVGNYALSSDTMGSYNTVIGANAGANAYGSGNVFLGYAAGANSNNSNELFIENSDADAANALIYGRFDENRLWVNGYFHSKDTISILSGGLKFPDGTVQTSAAMGDNMGNHMASQNIQLNDFWLTNAGSITTSGIRIDSAGQVGVGTATPDQLLSVNGDASKVGGGDWLTFSDKRLKKDIQPFSDGLQVLEKIAPVSFKYNGKAGYPNDGKEYIGVIAQDIQKVAPYTIQTIDKKIDENDSENTKLLMYDGTALTYILVNAVKELNADLKESNAALKAENKMLKERLDAIENMLNTLAGKAAEE